jgi:hypothetical protein
VNRQDADRQQVYREALAVERDLESCLSPTTYQVLS